VASEEELARALRIAFESTDVHVKEKIGGRVRYEEFGEFARGMFERAKSAIPDLVIAIQKISNSVSGSASQNLGFESDLILEIEAIQRIDEADARKSIDAKLERQSILLESIKTIIDKGFEGISGLPFLIVLQLMQEIVKVAKTLPRKPGPKRKRRG
jgi:hypothetical protein